MEVLEIGCGDNKVKAQSIGMDIRRTKATDVVGDARRLPFKSESFDLVFSSHTLEHFSHAETRSVLTEWIRVVRHEGKLEIRCPDLRARSFIFFVSPSLDNVRMIYGNQDYPENYHKSGFSYGLLKKLLRELGMVKIRRISRGYKGIPLLPDSLHVVCAKAFSGTKTDYLDNESRDLK